MQVKQALWDGGIARSNKPEGRRNTPGLQAWSDLVGICIASVCAYLYGSPMHLSVAAAYPDPAFWHWKDAKPVLEGMQALLYAGQLMDNSKCLQDYNVPRVRLWGPCIDFACIALSSSLALSVWSRAMAYTLSSLPCAASRVVQSC